MSFLPTPGLVVDALSGVLLLALGLWVASLRPRRATNLLFAAFAGVFGLSNVFRNVLTVDDPLAPLTLGASAAMLLASAALLLALALRFPRPLGAGERGLLAAAAPALLLTVGGLGAAVAAGDFGAARPLPPHILAWVLSSIVAEGAFWFVAALLALRHAKAPSEPRLRAQHALSAAGLVAWPAFTSGLQAAYPEIPLAIRAGSLAAALFVAALWLRASARAREGPEAAGARDVAWFLLAALLANLVLTGLLGGFAAASDSGLAGLSRSLTVLLLAYAVLRHQLLDIDVKVKWTLRQSTVAAAFIGVFFVVSESASSFLATEGGLGTYAGIAAAGVLVFAMAPLQRAAERVADAAMPGVKAPADMTPGERAATYRDMLRLAWQDGVVDKSERAMLLGLRERLGLSAEEALRLEQEALAGPRP